MSRTVAVLPPRRSSTKFIRASKESFFPSGSSGASPALVSSPSNKVSLKSTRPTTSTPTAARTGIACGCVTSCKNSSLDNIWSSSSSAPVSLRSSSILSRTKPRERVSRSVEATADTTSQITPISIFIMVRAERKMKAYKTNNKNKLCSFMGSTKPAKLSINAALRSSSCIAAGTLGKKTSHGESLHSWTKAMPKMYSRTKRRLRVKPTERIAASMPLMRMSSSGIARNSLAMRAIRVRRNKRAIRKIPAFCKPPPWPPLASNTTTGINQVSKTMVPTRNESKTNQASRSPLNFRLKAQKRITHSKLK
mmetsp:Transcript_12586/g.24637  ORF Transcript_12586/g.24637 Transcript_12586/m.24637 type:complete len:308 (-) Transcript_12586:486-1409(-)